MWCDTCRKPFTRCDVQVIEVPGYTVEEKVQIARRHLLPRQLEQHGIAEGKLDISAEVLNDIGKVWPML